MFELANAGDLGFDSERLGRIAPFLAETYIDSGRLPNAQLVVARDGKPVHYTKLGKMGDDGRELTDDALFSTTMAAETDAYLAEWRKAAPYQVEGEPEAVAEAEAARLDTEYDTARIKALIANDGWA